MNRVVPTAPIESGGVSVGSFGPARLPCIVGPAEVLGGADALEPVPAGWDRAQAASARAFAAR